MWAIYKREIQSYFKTPIGYIFIGMFLVISGVLFIFINLQSGSPLMRPVLNLVMYFFMFLIPVLTMRLLSEEKNLKTDQILLTSPVSVTNIVLGKFLAAFSVYLITLFLTLIYFIVIARHGEPYYAETFCNYLGFCLLGGAFISIGLFISSLTESQAVAAVSTFVAFMFLFLMGNVKDTIPSPFISSILNAISIPLWYNKFLAGVFDVVPTVYFISVISLFLFLTVQVIESRRWL